MQVTNEMVERAAKAVEKKVMQSTYGWTDDDFEIYWTRDPRCIEAKHFWGDAFGRGTEKDRLLWKIRIALEAAAMTTSPLCDAAPELLGTLKFAVARVRLANAEGDPILGAWLPDADAVIARAEGRADSPRPSSSGGGDES